MIGLGNGLLPAANKPFHDPVFVVTFGMKLKHIQVNNKAPIDTNLKR